MDQRIKITIAGQEYVLKAATQESEELIRKAAESINKKIVAFSSRFPDKALIDIMAFVALNESITSLTLQKSLDSANEEAAQLLADTSSYLKNM